MEILSEKITAYIAERLADKLEKCEKDAEKEKSSAAADLDRIETQFQSEKAALMELFRPENWLTDAAKRAEQISMVTHAAKYTHSDTRSSGILFSRNKRQSQESRYLSSASLATLAVDAVGNAAALDVARLLQMEANGKTLLDEVADGESPTLRSLATDETQYQKWLKGFQAALQNKQVRSGQLTKQIYFPLQDGSYHLINPLYASSLSHQVYQKIVHAFFSEETRSIREARKQGKYHRLPLVLFPNLAVQNFGGTKPQNISNLNTQRRGKGYLFSCQPPRWEAQDFLPKKGKEAFWREFSRRSGTIAKRLQEHLAQSFQKTSTLEIREKRAQLVDDLINLLLEIAAEIQNKKNLAGWSRESNLPDAEQLWLDPYRAKQDEAFAVARETDDWKQDIANSFARWLNRTIDKANLIQINRSETTLKTGEDEFKEWQKLITQKLEMLKEDLKEDPEEDLEIAR